MILDEHVQGLLEKYVKDDSVIAFGTGEINETFLKKLALYIERNDLNVKVVPTSHSLAALCVELKIKTASLNEEDVDLAFDFIDQIDEDFNYISNATTSLVRDKMIAQNASEFVVVCEENNFVKKLNFPITLEICPFAVEKTIVQAMNLGEVEHRKDEGDFAMSETGNHFLDIKVDPIYSIDDIDYQAKKIPGVLETSLFIGYADRVILHGDTLTVKSRLTNEK